MTRPPHVAALVHYVEPGMPDGPLECQAALVTGVLGYDGGLVNLTVFGEGQITYQHAVLPEHVAGQGAACGRRSEEGVGYPEGTWHWPVLTDTGEAR